MPAQAITNLDTVPSGTRLYMNFAHYGISIYGADDIRADLASVALPISINGIYEKTVSDITVDITWTGGATTVQDIGQQMADAMTSYWRDIRIMFLNASTEASGALVSPSEDVNKKINDTVQNLFDTLTGNITWILLAVGVIVVINAGGITAAKNIAKEI